MNNIRPRPGLLLFTPMKSTDFGASFFGMISVSPARTLPVPLLQVYICPCGPSPLNVPGSSRMPIPKCEHGHLVYGHVNRRWWAAAKGKKGKEIKIKIWWFIHFGNVSECTCHTMWEIPCPSLITFLTGTFSIIVHLLTRCCGVLPSPWVHLQGHWIEFPGMVR